MSYEELENTSFPEMEECIREVEDYAQKFFGNSSLKIGFRVYDGKQTITMEEYLNSAYNYGEFMIYFIKSPAHNGIKELVDHANPEHRDKIFLGGCKLIEQPGCCGMAVMYNSFISIDYRGKKFGQFLVKLLETIAKEKGFSTIVCTDRVSNEPQKAILDKFGFIKQFRFRNAKTNNLVEFRVKALNNNYNNIWKRKNLISRKYESIVNSLKRIYTTTITS
jgi:hypothetical protein